ncbi:MAG TPA: S8 family serine peptidase [Anaerolineae bacterium]
MKRFGILFLIGTLVLLYLAPGVVAVSNVKIDSRVLQDTGSGQAADFLVVLRSQSDTRAESARASDRIERGRLVYRALRQTADASQPAVRSFLEALGVPYHAYWVVNLFAVHADRSVVDALAARGDVLAIESDRAFHVDLEQAWAGQTNVPNTVEWNVNQVNAPALWAMGYTGQGLVYANADTGVRWDHPALQPHYRGWNGATADHNYNWWDAIHADLSGMGADTCETGGFVPLPASGSLQPCDDYGHGTHTMGTGIGDDGAGNQIGVAPGAKWMACRNMDNGVGRPSTYIECMQFFLAPTDLSGQNPDPGRRPDAVGNSYTCPPSEGCLANSLLTAMDNMRAAGILMAVAAGNSGPGCSSITDPPAIYDSAITAGATAGDDSIAGFSSRGPVTVDGSNRRKPDLAAPGVGVRSSFNGSGASYIYMSGTSMAAPHVAGAALLLWSAFPALRGQVGQTEYVFQQSALHKPASQMCGGDVPGQVPNNDYGYGRIDALAAFRFQQNFTGLFKLFLPDIKRN